MADMYILKWIDLDGKDFMVVFVASGTVKVACKSQKLPTLELEKSR